LLLGAPPLAHAATPLTRAEQSVINFGFATQLGSGIYSMSGRTLQVYNLPFEVALPAAEGARVRPRLTLPVTIGFIDFEARDVIESGLPERLDSLGFVPGIALEIPIRDEWSIEPFAEAGVAIDRTNEMDQRIYALGIRSRVDLERGDTTWQIYDEVVRVVVEQVSLDGTDDFTRLTIGTTARRPFDTSGEGRRPDFLAYGLMEVFSDAPAGPADAEPEQTGQAQVEVGVTLGATETLKICGIPLPRVGLGYRFGDGLSVYRLVFGSPF
jgi:Fe2+ transport system protein FeoA